MCHHFQAAARLPQWLVDEYKLGGTLHLLEEYSGGFYPLSTVPVIRAVEDGHELAGMEWGLLPRWWLRSSGGRGSDKQPKRSTFQRKTFNARSETVHEKPTYREAFKHRRCLIPAQAFEEKRHYFSLPSGEAFCFAGLWESWSGADGELLTCTVLTTEPCAAVADVGHHRMPVLLADVEACRTWLNSESPATLADLFTPFMGELVVEPIVL